MNDSNGHDNIDDDPVFPVDNDGVDLDFMDGSPTEKGSAWMMEDANQLLRWVLKSKNRNLTTTTPMKTARFFWDLDFEDNSDQGSSEAPDGSYDFRQRCVSSSVRQENWTTNYRVR